MYPLFRMKLRRLVPSIPSEGLALMHYLAIHDFVWINTVVTGVQVPYDPVALEQAMAAQYAYGTSTDPLRQAAYLLKTMLRKPPFAEGNLATTFLVVATFLAANGYDLAITGREAADLMVQCARGEVKPSDAIQRMAVQRGGGLQPGDTLRTLVARLCHEHSEVLEVLAQTEERIAA